MLALFFVGFKDRGVQGLHGGPSSEWPQRGLGRRQGSASQSWAVLPADRARFILPWRRLRCLQSVLQ